MLPTDHIKKRPRTHSTPLPATSPITTPENVRADIHSPQPIIVDKQPPSKRRKTARMSIGSLAPRRRPKTEHPSSRPKPENYTLPRGKAS